MIMDGIVKRACNEGIAENELISLQSIFLKLLAHFNNLEDIFTLVGLFNLSCGFTSLLIMNRYLLSISFKFHGILLFRTFVYIFFL